ncbi:unnamed protein product [Clonostachys rosea f. rosea IK726]|uniref:Shugoshin C-terminal domain-containing protein n=3 Tax=Bionectria ochroleuca TaxID=29856 RepID=A0A0B7JTD3_BIOOC|nr:unnamed protein product [Clonostachys rosea f. rosea IK726]
MARLNEPPVSTDSLETLRRKLLRQNRDLAKSNNVRALKIRELENDCACMLSENLQLRSRILELEKQVEDNDARRIADHALAIKAKLESQLTEWGDLIAGLGLEPPPKRHSPSIRRTSSSRRRTSCAYGRVSPSQRRLREVAREIEELGSISEHKSYPRLSMNPEQILALRSEADSVESPELGPPPMSQFIDNEPAKVESPPAKSPEPLSPSPRNRIQSPELLPSPRADPFVDNSPSPKKRDMPLKPMPQLQSKTESLKSTVRPLQLKPLTAEAPAVEKQNTITAPPAKAGTKRKFSVNDDLEKTGSGRDENQPPRMVASKASIREKTGGKTLKELVTMRKDTRDQASAPLATRKPLSAKNTNDDFTSPKKNPKSGKAAILDDVAIGKAELAKSKPIQEPIKSKTKNSAPLKVVPLPSPEPEPVVAIVNSEPETSDAQPTKVSRGSTPPPVNMPAEEEVSRPSRRSRPTISYAEPNLRDKMRRPTKELVDAVAGSRRISHSEPIHRDISKRNHDPETSAGAAASGEIAHEKLPLSPAGKVSQEEEAKSRSTDGSKRSPSTTEEEESREEDTSKESSENITGSDDVDLYEFTSSSPKHGKQGPAEGKRRRGPSRQSRSSRRFSAAVDQEDESFEIREQTSSRRRSMMV